MFYKCERCGREKETKYPSHAKRFCSHKCAIESVWENRKRKEFGLFLCSFCGKEFAVPLNDHRLKTTGVKYCSKLCNYEGKKTGSIKKCLICGNEFYTTRNKTCSIKCGQELRARGMAKGKVYKENGYLVVYIRGYNKKGNAKVHRLAAEKNMGRKLLKSEVVHHINGDRTDNRIENLRVMGWGEHSSLHRAQEKKRKLLLWVHGIRIREV